jgi:TonB family protein
MKNFILVLLTFMFFFANDIRAQRITKFKNVVIHNGLICSNNEKLSPVTGRVVGKFQDSKQKKIDFNVTDGKLDGLRKVWYSSGQLKHQVSYKDGKLDGLRIDWYPDGQLQYEINFKNGKRDGFYKGWYPDGQIQTERNHKDGKLDGLRKEWYSSGQLKHQVSYKDGKLDGLRIDWYPDGQLQYEINFKNGKRDGLARGLYQFIEQDEFNNIWYENGSLKYSFFGNPQDGKLNLESLMNSLFYGLIEFASKNDNNSKGSFYSGYLIGDAAFEFKQKIITVNYAIPDLRQKRYVESGKVEDLAIKNECGLIDCDDYHQISLQGKWKNLGPYGDGTLVINLNKKQNLLELRIVGEENSSWSLKCNLKNQKKTIEALKIFLGGIYTDNDLDDAVYDLEVIERGPVYPGCEYFLTPAEVRECFNQKIKQFINRNVEFPEMAKQMGVAGKVWVSFIINNDGNVSDVKIERSVDKLLDDEALRVIRELPKILPAKADGLPVRLRYSVPINFQLPQNYRR